MGSRGSPAISVANTKLGGLPDVPPDFDWPHDSSDPYDPQGLSTPLWFIAQYHLDELAHALPDYFPRTGLLSFWAMIHRFPYEGQPGGWRIFHFDPAAVRRCERAPAFPPSLRETLEDWSQPSDTAPLLRECRLETEPCIALPTEWFYDHRSDPRDQTYIQHRVAIGRHALDLKERHLLGGCSQLVKLGHGQSLKMAQHLHPVVYPPGASIPEKVRLDREDHPNWRLIAHFDSDSAPRLIYGRLHFLARQDSLTRAAFQESVLVSDYW